MLVDPICAVPALVDDRIIQRDTALLIGLDASGWDTSPEGYRLSKLVPGISARSVRQLGATGGKIMVYLRSDREEANIHNIKILRQCIDDFAQEDLLLVVEFLTYRFDGEDEADYKAKLLSLVIGGSQDLPGLRSEGAGRFRILEALKPARKSRGFQGDVPWAVLSAGVDHSTFLKQVEDAMRNGASGVIAGRSLWKDCISLDRSVTKDRLQSVAVPRLREIQAVISAHFKGVKSEGVDQGQKADA